MTKYLLFIKLPSGTYFSQKFHTENEFSIREILIKYPTFKAGVFQKEEEATFWFHTDLPKGFAETVMYVLTKN